MSGTFPTTPVAMAATVRSLTPTRISTAHSLKQSRRSIGSQRWALALTWQNLRRSEMAPILAFAIAQRGQYGTFQIGLAGHAAPQGTWAGSPAVSGAGQVGRSIALSGFTAGATGKAGDFFKYAGHSKVYMLTADFTADGGGLATITQEPALMATPANAEALSAANVPFTVAFAADIAEAPVRPGLFYDFQAQLIEVW